MAMQCGKCRLLKISEAVTVCQMFVATESNSHHILQMSVLWLDHSISLHHHLHLKFPSWSQDGTCQPAWLIQASIKLCPVLCSTHTPWGAKTTWKNCQAGYKDRTGHREVYGHRPKGYFRKQVIGLLKKERASRGHLFRRGDPGLQIMWGQTAEEGRRPSPQGRWGAQKAHRLGWTTAKGVTRAQWWDKPACSCPKCQLIRELKAPGH